MKSQKKEVINKNINFNGNDDKNLQFNRRKFFASTGRIVSTGDGVAKVTFLDSVCVGEFVLVHGKQLSKIGEPIRREANIPAMALNLNPNTVDIVLFGDPRLVAVGRLVFGTGKLVRVPTGPKILGRVINPIGQPIDGRGLLNISDDFYMSVDVKAPGILPRRSVNEPFLTGIKALDSMIPIGRGQRQLIIGDRQTGKSTIAIDAIINQKNLMPRTEHESMFCIYTAIGQKKANTAYLTGLLARSGALKYTTIVVATAADQSSLQYLAPYSGCTIGEYYRDRGFHAAIVYDDLSKHAAAYRQMSLLLRRPPGREAYPGDVFYLHSRLLERSAKMSKKYGLGSLTALPVIETLESDVSAYIPTNVISITDGQIFIEKNLVIKGIMPAINCGLSVSRVGSAAQAWAIRSIVSSLRLQLTQFREIEDFASYSSDLDQVTLRILARGARLTEFFKQGCFQPIGVDYQAILIFALMFGYFDKIETEQVKRFEQFVIFLLNETNYWYFADSIEPFIGIDYNTYPKFLSQAIYLFKKCWIVCLRNRESDRQMREEILKLKQSEVLAKMH